MQLGTEPGIKRNQASRGGASGAETPPWCGGRGADRWGVRARLVGLTRSGRSYRSKSSSTFSVTGWDWQAST